MLLCLAFGAGAIGSVRAPRLRQPPVSGGLFVQVYPSAITARLPGSYLGIDVEYPTIPQWTGFRTGGVNEALINLIRNLAGPAGPILRVGGLSTDRTWWPVPGMRRPLGVTNRIGPIWLRDLRAIVDGTRARLIAGINMEANSASLAHAEASHLLVAVGAAHVLAFELGNEPELWPSVPWFRVGAGHQIIPYNVHAAGVPVYARPPGYNPTSFAAEFARLRLALPGLPVAGPSSGNNYWISRVPELLASEPGLAMVTIHRYGLDGCQTDRAARDYTSIPHLLSLYASRRLMTGVRPQIANAHNAHAAFQVDELNSAYCGGVPGVSNTFASALWILDTLFSLRNDGVDGINIHTSPSAANGLFDFARLKDVWHAVVHPEYYGLLLFHDAAPPGSRLLKLSTTASGQLRIWATVAGNQVHVLLINDSAHVRATVHVQVPLVTPTDASVVTLRARGIAATAGVTLGGLSFGPDTTTGELRPVQRHPHVPAGLPYAILPPAHSEQTPVPAAPGLTHPTYTVTVAPASATLLTWNGRIAGLP